MKKHGNQPADAAALRRRAEARLQTRERTPQSRIRNPQSAQRLVHELEMQNEELRQARVKTEALLAQYTDLYDSAPVGYLTLNEPGLILQANLTGARLFGVARKDLVRQRLTRLILREDRGIFNEHHQQLFATRAAQNCRLRLKRPNGMPLWVRLDASVTPGSDDDAPVCRVTLSDLTGRKQAEADRERLAQFERLAQLMKCASDIIVLSDEHGRILEANDRALETYGYSLAELRQKTVEDLRTPQSRAELPQQAEQLETDGRTVFEAMHQRRDGVAFPVEISACFLQIAGVRYRLGIVRDITERKRAAEALRRSETELRAILESTADGILAVDSHGKVIHANRRFAQLWRIPPALLETSDDRTLLDYVLDQLCDPDAFLKKVQSLYHSDAVDMGTLAFKDGRLFERFSEPMVLGGAIIGRVWSFRDISERKRAEEVLRVSHRFLDITNRQTEMIPLLKEFLAEVRNFTGCDAVGLRMLDAEGNIPYQAYEGFSRRFYESESPLSIRSDQCMCINVIKGTTDPKRSFYTESGSFYMNATPRFLATVSEEEKGRTRNVCNQSGYESVALVPIRLGDSILGLVHVADHHENMVPLEMVEVLEGAAMQLGTAIERVRADEALRESEARFRALFDGAAEGIYQSTPAGQFRLANPALARILGYASPQELIANITDIRRQVNVDPGLRAEFKQRIEECSGVQGLEFQVRRKDGLVTWVSENAHAVRDTSGAVRYYEGTIEDITERKQGEEILRARLRLLQFAAAHSLGELLQQTLDEVGLLTDSPIGFYHFVAAAQKALSLQVWSTRTLREFCRAEGKGWHYDVDKAGVWVDCIRQRRAVIHNDYAALPHRKGLPPGHAPVVRELVVPVFRQDRIVAVLGVGNKPRDYTEKDVQIVTFMADVAWESAQRKLAEKARQTSAAYARSLIEASLDPLVTISAEGKITDVNEASAQATGVPREKLIGTDFADYFTEPEKAREGYRRAFAEGSIRDYPLAIRHVSGRVTEVLYNASVYRDAQGQVLGIFAAARDITERLQAEERVRMFSQEIIAAREQERKQVSSVLHHDVGSLTVGISAHFDAIEADLRSGKPGEALEWIRRARKLFDESVARLKKLAVELRPPELDVLGLCAALRQYFAQVTEGGRTRIHFRETLGPRRLSGETATILFRVAQEALTNAITHGHATRVDVGVRVSKEEVQLTVRNNGKTFDPSEKTAQSTSHMGLRVMREMALSAGGVFTVDSVRGKGTTVRVRLPIAGCGMRIAECGLKETTT